MPDGPICARCGSPRVCRLYARAFFECYACRKQFSVTSGTILHATHLPFEKWILASSLICNAKKGISAKQIERDLKVTCKTAWYLMHRIRRAMQEPGLIAQFVGIVEIEETYVGGKARGKRGRGAANKTIVVGMRERGGAVRTEIAVNLKKYTLWELVRKHVSTNAKMVCTDDLSSYDVLRRSFNPEKVNHSTGEYVRGGVHTSSIERLCNILKRGIIGSYHKVSVG